MSGGGGHGSGSACPRCMPGSDWARRCRATRRRVPWPTWRPGSSTLHRQSGADAWLVTEGRASTPGRARIPVTIHRTSEPGTWVVAFPWREDGRAQAIAEAALRLVDLDLDPRTTRPATRRTAGRPGRSRTLTRALRTIRDAETGPPAWIRDTERRMPAISISGTNGKTTTTRMISHILRAAGRHTGTTTSDGVLFDDVLVEAGDLTGPYGARAVLANPDAGRRRPGDGARRHDAPGRGLRIERRVRAHQRQLRPHGPPRHPYPARAGRGEVGHLPHDPSGGRGGAQRGRRPGRGRRRSGARAGLAVLHDSRARRGSDGTSPRAARPSCWTTAGWWSWSRAHGGPSSRSRTCPRRSVGWPSTTSPMRSPPQPGHGRWAPRWSRWRTGLRTFAPSAEQAPGRLNLYRRDATTVIVDFAHNEAGVSAVLDVAAGLVGDRRARGPVNAHWASSSAPPATDPTTPSGASPASPRNGPTGWPSRRPSHYLRGRTRESIVGELRAGITAGGGDGRHADGLPGRAVGGPGRAGATTVCSRATGLPGVLVVMCHEDRLRGRGRARGTRLQRRLSTQPSGTAISPGAVMAMPAPRSKAIAAR